MANVIALPTYTYEGQEANEVFMKPIFTDPDLMRLFRVIPNVRSRMKIAVDNTLSNILKKKTTCGLTASGGPITVGQVDLETQLVGFNLEQCAIDLLGTFWEQFLNSGNELSDLTDTYVFTYLEQKVREALSLDIPRIVMWADTASANANFNHFDGIVKQLQALAVANPTMKKTNIVAGAPAAGTTIAEFEKLYAGQSATLRAMPKNRKRYIVSGERYDALYDAYIAASTNSAEVYLRMVQTADGEGQLTYKGIEIQPERHQSTSVAAMGSSILEIMILTDTQNIVIGTDRLADTNNVKTGFYEREELNYIKGQFQLGTQVVYPDLTVFANRVA